MNTPSPGPGSPPGYNGPSDTPYQPIHQAPTQAPYQDPQKTPHDGLHSPPAPAYGPSDSHDAGAWNQPAQVPHASAPGLEPGKWHESYCGFCSPFDVCMMAWCFPCVTFGKTHHRLRWGNNMENYEPFNTSVCQEERMTTPETKKRKSMANNLVSALIVLCLLWSSVLWCPVDTTDDATVRIAGETQHRRKLLRGLLLGILLPSV